MTCTSDYVKTAQRLKELQEVLKNFLTIREELRKLYETYYKQYNR